MIFGARVSFLFQLPTGKEHNWVTLKPCQVLIPPSSHLKKWGGGGGRVAGGKCGICHLCWVRFYTKHMLGSITQQLRANSVFWNKKSKLLTDRKNDVSSLSPAHHSHFSHNWWFKSRCAF